MSSKTADKKSDVNIADDKKDISEKNVTTSPTIAGDKPNLVIIKTTEKSNEDVVEKVQGDKKVVVNTDQKQVTAIEVPPKNTSEQTTVSTTSATIESAKAIATDTDGKQVVTTSSLTVTAPVTVKEIVIPTTESKRTGRLRFASWNIEWFDQLIEERKFIIQVIYNTTTLR